MARRWHQAHAQCGRTHGARRLPYRLPDSRWMGGRRSIDDLQPEDSRVAWQVRVNDEIVADNLDDWRMTPFRSLSRRCTRGDCTQETSCGSTSWSRSNPEWVTPGTCQRGSREGTGVARIGAAVPAVFSAHRLQHLDAGHRRVLPAVLLLRRRERMHLLLALSCMAWCVSNLSPSCRGGTMPRSMPGTRQLPVRRSPGRCGSSICSSCSWTGVFPGRLRT